jgi:GNAT superfamily N-acetyltransferase
VSVQLDALADQVFDAAAAQTRISGESIRLPYGEAIRSPQYPDLFFMNVVVDLVAPSWDVTELESALREALPGVRNLRATSRDPHTIRALGPRLAAAGFQADVRLAMLQVREPNPSRSPKLVVAEVEAPQHWRAFETLTRADAAEQGWSAAMTAQIIALYHWRAGNAPQRLFLAYDGGGAVANVGLFQHGTTAYLHALFTHPSVRRRGVGSALTIAMSEQARAMGCERLTLQCTKDSDLPAFYERLGFRTVGEQQIWWKTT